MKVLFLLIVFPWVSFVYAKFPVTKERVECDEWATQGECINNPSYMWSACHTSCMELANNTEIECDQWAEEGECTNNPLYINIHCPISCNKAIGWNPWTRIKAGIVDPMPLHEIFAKNWALCTKPSDIIGAAETMAAQVLNFVEGGLLMTPALSATAPTEYLGMLGLVEALMYSLRLYDINSKLVLEALSEKVALVPELKAVIAQASENHNVILEEYQTINEEVARGYSSDVLMRKLPIWSKALVEASLQATKLLTPYTQFYPSYAINDTSVCPSPRGPPISNLTSVYSQLEQKSSVHVTPKVTLSNGLTMPTIGLGTWQISGGDCEVTVIEAIKQGYRHIDTAQAYGNEANVGWGLFHAMKEGLVTRQELFVATKISNEEDGGYESTKRLVAHQLEQLKLQYIDLYMLHSPMSDSAKQMETWKALEELVDEGKIKSLGISNFGERELTNLLSYARIKPVVMQNKVDVYHIGKQLDPSGDKVIELAMTNKIVTVAYSSFSSYPFVMKPTEDPIVKYVAKKVGYTPGQVILRWLLQKGVAVIPRSTKADRLKENIDVLYMTPLESPDMHLLNTLQYLIETPVTRPIPF